MTETVKQEFMRLVDLLPQTDPRTEAYHILLSSIERFDAIGSTINDMVDVIHSEAALDAVTVEAGWAKDQVGKVVELTAKIDPDKVPVHPIPTVPFTAPDFPAETPEEQEGHEVAELVKKVVEEQPAPPQSPAPVQQTYDAPTVRKALLDARARGVNVKEVLKGFGADGFQAVPADRYADLMAALQAV